MLKVVFVGDEPSSLNASPEIPFVGSRSLNLLIEYIKIIKPDYYIVVNSSAPEDIAKILVLYDQGFRIITLGQAASNRIDKLKLGEAYNLPHPSPRNRGANNKKGLTTLLSACAEWCRL